jgi:predicted amidohydrolase YtcJ
MLGLGLGLSAILAVAAIGVAPPPTIVFNAKFYTLDAANAEITALAFDTRGRVLAVGDLDGLARRYPQAQREDLHGAFVVPGLIDAHGHVLNLGRFLREANLVGTASKAEILTRLKAYAATLPKDEWLLGRGWDQNRWSEKQFPDAADLDAAFPDRPVWLRRIDGHAGWANSAAMKKVKRTLSGDWQPSGGRIERHDGQAAGVFVDQAMAMVDEIVPPPTEASLRQAYLQAFAHMVAVGLTGVHDAGVGARELKVLRRMADASEIPLRLYAMADGNGSALDALCRTGLYQHPSGHLQMRTVKLYADGALGSRGAQLLEDYSDDAGNRGLPVMSDDELRAAMTKAARCGVQVATHAIGDRGNRRVLDLYEQTLAAQPQPDARWRIEHAQIVNLDDIPRFHKLGIIASMQPTHATSDMPWAAARLGKERLVGAYAWQRFVEADVHLALGSDFPVESDNPLLGLYAAITRQDSAGEPAGGWMPDQRLTPEQALLGFTLDAAYAEFAENDLGSLSVGKRADFTVLSVDPVWGEPADLLSAHVLATYVDGKAVYRAAAGER